MAMKKKLMIICGPTATGKTKLGVYFARKYNGEILSADSRQVYRGMDIGTGKDLAEYGSIKYWGIDLCAPDHDFNVSEYVRYAQGALADIWSRGKLPIVVGGTCLYIKELLRPSQTLHIPSNPTLRKSLEKLSVPKLQEKLQKVNHQKWDSMNFSDQKNPRRLIRAIEVTGKIASSQSPRNDADVLIIGLTASYKYLYQRIDKRVEERIKNGMAEEKEKLKKYKKIPKTLGYGQETVEEWKYAEHAYARRQMSFFRNLSQTYPIKWYNISDDDLPKDINL